MKIVKILSCLFVAVLLCACGDRPQFQIGDFLTQDLVGDQLVGSENAEAEILLSGNSAEINGDGAVLEDGILKITLGGVYNISGELDGSIVVSATKEDVVELVFNGVSISSESAAVYVECVDKAVITLADGSENRLSDGKDYAKEDGIEPAACLYSADDLTINGSGKLMVEANCRNGIQTKNDLRIKGGDITVTAAKNALKGKDNVEISGGIIKVLASTDAIKSDNETEDGRGNVIISGGELQLTCQDDAIQAFRSVKISGCKIGIAAGDNQINCDGEVEAEEDCIAELQMENDE